LYVWLHDTIYVERTVFADGEIVREDSGAMFVRAYPDDGIADTPSLKRIGSYAMPTFKSGAFTELTDERISIRFETSDGRVFEKSILIPQERRLPSAAELAKRRHTMRVDGGNCSLIIAATLAERDRNQTDPPVRSEILKFLDTNDRIVLKKTWQSYSSANQKLTLDQWDSRWKHISVFRQADDIYVLNDVEDGRLYVGRWNVRDQDPSEEFLLTVRFDRYGIYAASSRQKLTPTQRETRPKLAAAHLSHVAPDDLAIVLDLADGGRLEKRFELTAQPKR
jgi:hypothetical protein